MENYTKIRIIGSGSFGTVWLARSKFKQRNYVLKEISLNNVDQSQRHLVLNEVKLLSRIRHIHIIRYKEAFLGNGFLCITMEYAERGDLSDFIKESGGKLLPKHQILDWFIQLCLALKYIHGINILHRDIKCQNIFLSKENIIKLGDFGIACVLENTLDHANTIIGTPYNLSPEICSQQPYNHKSDMWALGCVLYEMITFHHPFESSDFPQLVLKILQCDFKPIHECHGRLLHDLVTILLRVEPMERPSAKQVLHIPAMQPYVSKVLLRGTLQRSESMSCNKDLEKWQKPDVITSNKDEDVSQRCDLDVLNHMKSQVAGSIMDDKNTCCNRKRLSSEVFPLNEIDPNSKYEELNIDGRNDFQPSHERNKDSKESPRISRQQRSYSTSVIRESTPAYPTNVPRSPLAPLNSHQVYLRRTYDVIRMQKQMKQETYTKISSCQLSTSLTGKQQIEVLKALVEGHNYKFDNISSNTSLREYVDVMKRKLLEGLGHKTFNNLRKYFLSDDMDCDGVSERFYNTLAGCNNMQLISLFLHYIRCEKDL